MVTRGNELQVCKENSNHTYARELLRNGHAYPCFCTREELAQMTEEQLAAKLQTGYYGTVCTYRSADEIRWSKPAYGLYFQELFTLVYDPSDPRFAPVEPAMVAKLAKTSLIPIG